MPVTEFQQRQAARMARVAERQTSQISDNVLASIRADLQSALDATVKRLANASATWDMRQSQIVLAELQRQMALWDSTTVSRLSGAMTQAHLSGTSFTLAQLGVEASVAPFVSTQVLRVSQQTLPVLITDVSHDVIQQVGRILRKVALGQGSPFEAMQQIARFIPPKGGPGPFGSAFLRSESIVRTEVGRIYQQASYSQLDALGQRDQQVQKQWVAMMDSHTRPAHRVASGQIRPVNEPFEVGGAELMYPKDPNGPAGQTVNCRCVMVPWHDSWNSVGASSDVTTSPSFDQLFSLMP